MYKGGEKPYEHYQQTYKKVFNNDFRLAYIGISKVPM